MMDGDYTIGLVVFINVMVIIHEFFNQFYILFIVVMSLKQRIIDAER